MPAQVIFGQVETYPVPYPPYPNHNQAIQPVAQQAVPQDVSNGQYAANPYFEGN